MIKKIGKKDQQKISGAINRKVIEYSFLSIEDLEKLQPTLGGSYRLACDYMIAKKKSQPIKTETNESEID